MTWLAFAALAAVVDATKDLVSKRVMATASPALAAWALFAVAAPILVAATFITGVPVLGPAYLESIAICGLFFVAAIALYMKAIQASDLSITLPMIAFTPIFLLLTGSLVLGELPTGAGLAGVPVIVTGAYLLNVRDMTKGLLAPFVALGRERGPRLMLIVSLLFSVTAAMAKRSVLQSSPLAAFAGIYVVSTLLFSSYVIATRQLTWSEIARHWRGALAIGALMSVVEVGIAYALSLSLAVYVVSVKRLSILVGALLGVAVLKERNAGPRVLGAVVMLAGIFLIAWGARG